MDNCCHDKACELEQLRQQQSKTLWIVLGINAVMFRRPSPVPILELGARAQAGYR